VKLRTTAYKQKYGEAGLRTTRRLQSNTCGNNNKQWQQQRECLWRHTAGGASYSNYGVYVEDTEEDLMRAIAESLRK
jgi:hypothetical protein